MSAMYHAVMRAIQLCGDAHSECDGKDHITFSRRQPTTILCGVEAYKDMRRTCDPWLAPDLVENRRYAGLRVILTSDITGWEVLG